MKNNLQLLAQQLGQQLTQRHWQLALAESCTGGSIAATITDIAGSSAWFDRGFVPYSNAAKMQMLGVKTTTLEQFGAVSQATALEMATGALTYSQADLALAVTGIAGPSGGSADKPVGTVFIAWQQRHQTADCLMLALHGDRLAIRQQVIALCLQQALRLIPTDF